MMPESHIRYLAECALGEALTASKILVSADAHVDAALGKVTPMPWRLI
ncbi:MAG: hypothetical protein H0V48_00065 [Nocardioidaceae bacterium]|nr:hypothetical protein [Nocardioidaceae bacterium]